jgi:putative FmdB family regulatory protein
MPTYEYRCPNGHLFEVFKSISAPAPDKCPVCDASPLEVVLHPVAVHFKGSGFYSTDYGRGGSRRKDGEKAGDSGSSDGAGGGEKKTEKTETTEKTKAAEA